MLKGEGGGGGGGFQWTGPDSVSVLICICVCVMSNRVIYWLSSRFFLVLAESWTSASLRRLEVMPATDSTSVTTLAMSFALCFHKQFNELWNILKGCHRLLVIIEVSVFCVDFSFFCGLFIHYSYSSFLISGFVVLAILDYYRPVGPQTQISAGQIDIS